MSGIFEDYQFKRRKICSHCEGSGAESPADIGQCPYCEGRGQWNESVEYLPSRIGQLEHFCDECNGTGKIVKKRCHECHGSGMVEEDTAVKLILRAGVHSNYTELFED